MARRAAATVEPGLASPRMVSVSPNALRTEAMAAELHLIDAGPGADDVGGVEAQHQLPQRRVDVMRHRAGRAPVVRLAPADQAVIGDDLHDDGIALDGAADAQGDAGLGGD